MLYNNPGAARRQGCNEYRTVIRFDIDQSKIQNVEVINLGTMRKVPV